MFGLTTLGIVHTIISLSAVAAGVIALVGDGKITIDNAIGKFYIMTTVIVCLTGFGIFQHGGFGKPHVLGIITLVVLSVAYSARNNSLFGSFAPYVERVSYSMTFFFHIVPGITESATRLPLDAPLAASPEDPSIQMAIGASLILFIIGATLQVRSLRAKL